MVLATNSFVGRTTELKLENAAFLVNSDFAKDLPHAFIMS